MISGASISSEYILLSHTNALGMYACSIISVGVNKWVTFPFWFFLQRMRRNTIISGKISEHQC